MGELLDPRDVVGLMDEIRMSKQFRALNRLDQEAQTIFERLRKLDAGAPVIQELFLAQQLLGTVRLAWELADMTPGRMAAVAQEESDLPDIAEIEQLKVHTAKAIETAQASILRGRSILSQLEIMRS